MGVQVVGWARKMELNNTALYKPDWGTFSQFILSTDYYNRSIFLRIKLHMAILITDTDHWIHAVPSQQSEVILVIRESKHDITNTFWTKPDVLVQEGC